MAMGDGWQWQELRQAGCKACVEVCGGMKRGWLGCMEKV